MNKNIIERKALNEKIDNDHYTGTVIKAVIKTGVPARNFSRSRSSKKLIKEIPASFHEK